MAEKICPRCHRVCFSETQFKEHACFDMTDLLDAEIAACKFEQEWRSSQTGAREEGGVMAENWQPISTAPEGIPVLTKIEDAKGIRNVQRLKRQGRLWFFEDGSMYVYYEPTHWSRADA